MRSEVVVAFGAAGEFEVTVHGGSLPPADEARRWLDEQFVANDCEPLRPSGKVLTADKVLALAAAVGPSRFSEDTGFRDAFAHAVVAALGKPVVRIDVDAAAVTF
jgi:hypothetical protein